MVVRFPFSIRLAAFKDVKTSGKFMGQLKKDGYSPSRLGGTLGDKTGHAVYLGAFETKGGAENAVTALAKSGLTPVVAVP
ncbi:MAG: SPOR domain-containing protein [Nitrospinae bacterium]|nr:SPOR domain-containing protein [Nitrospinota bacterium]